MTTRHEDADALRVRIEGEPLADAMDWLGDMVATYDGAGPAVEALHAALTTAIEERARRAEIVGCADCGPLYVRSEADGDTCENCGHAIGPSLRLAAERARSEAGRVEEAGGPPEQGKEHTPMTENHEEARSWTRREQGAPFPAHPPDAHELAVVLDRAHVAARWLAQGTEFEARCWLDLQRARAALSLSLEHGDALARASEAVRRGLTTGHERGALVDMGRETWGPDHVWSVRGGDGDPPAIGQVVGRSGYWRALAFNDQGFAGVFDTVEEAAVAVCESWAKQRRRELAS